MEVGLKYENKQFYYDKDDREWHSIWDCYVSAGIREPFDTLILI